MSVSSITLISPHVSCFFEVIAVDLLGLSPCSSATPMPFSIIAMPAYGRRSKRPLMQTSRIHGCVLSEPARRNQAPCRPSSQRAHQQNLGFPVVRRLLSSASPGCKRSPSPTVLLDHPVDSFISDLLCDGGSLLKDPPYFIATRTSGPASQSGTGARCAIWRGNRRQRFAELGNCSFHPFSWRRRVFVSAIAFFARIAFFSKVAEFGNWLSGRMSIFEGACSRTCCPRSVIRLRPRPEDAIRPALLR